MIFEQCKVGCFFAWADRDPGIKSPVLVHNTLCFLLTKMEVALLQQNPSSILS